MPEHSRLPWYAYAVGAVVLVVALIMAAPGEYQLARQAGWGPWTAAGMPICLSTYAAFAVWFVETRRKGERGRGTAIAGAIVALGMALSAQVVAHWLAAGYMQTSMALTAAASSVPSIVVGHVAHMVIRAARRPETDAAHGAAHQDQTESKPKATEPVQPTLDGTEPPVDEMSKARAKRRTGRPAPSLDEIKAAAKALTANGREITGPALADHMGRDRRTGSRYLKKLNTATA
ncbi:hypothetical protein [Streptomyces sp. NPDC091278]|uniref:hypothetical protein n=1 Tax=Streptomyces sp. NPDC091278 TaxID=3155301 RepID=UPI00344EE5B5